MKTLFTIILSLTFMTGDALSQGKKYSEYPNSGTLQSGDLFLFSRGGAGTFNIDAFSQLTGALGLQPTNANLTDWAALGTNNFANTVSNNAFGSSLSQINTTSNSLQGQITSGGVTLTQLNITSNSVYGNAVTQINAASNSVVTIDQTSVNATSNTIVSRTITVAGTANQITSSAGAQDLSANRTATLSFPSTLIAPGSFTATTFFGLDQWLMQTNAATHALNISNAVYGGSITLTTNGIFAINGAPLINATSLGANQLPYTDGLTNFLSSTNNTEFELPLAPSANATNYPLDFSNARKVTVKSANTNANFTFVNASTNHSIDLYVNALTSTVPCTVTFPAHVRLNHFASLSVSNTTSVYYHIDFKDGTDPTNAVVTGGDFYTIQ